MPASTKRQPMNILVVEDNQGDAELIYEAFIRSSTPKDIHFAHDGDEALDYLHRRAKHHSAPRPDIILLDINMPRKSGTQVLAEIKQDLGLQNIPVIMLTSSKSQRDVNESYRLLANAYVVKPDSLSQLSELAKTIEDFWAGYVLLPQSPVKH
jgi:chemotaxis family two-component system response regulator Rcp1